MKAYSVKITTEENGKLKIIFMPCKSFLEATKEKEYWMHSKNKVEIICEEC